MLENGDDVQMYNARSTYT